MLGFSNIVFNFRFKYIVYMGILMNFCVKKIGKFLFLGYRVVINRFFKVYVRNFGLWFFKIY